MSVFNLLYGCMHLGGAWDNQPVDNATQTKANQLLSSLIELGVFAYDHADIYCRGKSEIAFGQFLRSSGIKRDTLFIQSKCGIELGVGAKGSNHYKLDKEYIIAQTFRSIKILSCDYLDALLLHRPDTLWQADKVAEAFYYLKAEGMVKSFGVSNMHPNQIALLKTHFPDIAYNQLQFSLSHTPLIDDDVMYNTGSPAYGTAGNLAYHSQHNIEIQAWSPLGQGAAIHEDNRATELYARIQQLSDAYHVSKEAILLAWIAKLPEKIIPVLGSSNIERIKGALAFTNVDLKHDEWYDLWILARANKLP